MADFELVGDGLTVYQDDRVIEGPVRFLDSPSAVLEFVRSGRAAETVVLARGGTTTFLTPALTEGVKGVLTLRGAPESHLGILAREFGIPCLMSVEFTRGVRTARGELVPPDGAVVRLDVSTAPRGQVLLEAGAATGAETATGAGAAEDGGRGGDGSGGGEAAERERVEHLLHHFRGEIPHGPEGDRRVRAGLRTDVLTTDAQDRELTREELNELLGYMSWNVWDNLALRATEGESGLIPRQEYEAVALVQIWQRYPELLRFLTREVGPDGVREIGGLSRREIGTKVNMLHMWCLGFCTGMGRSIAMNLGRLGARDREPDLLDSLQFMRRLFAGLRGPGAPLFATMNGYTSPVLEEGWLTRFADERHPVSDPEERDRLRRFSANAELMGFLMHFDSRPGLHDSGPYPTADGGFLIVRDHFLSDDLYHWGDVADGLPHAVTQAMTFHPDGPLEVSLGDLGTLFTRPADYLRHLTGMTVYARDRWDTPPEAVRRLDDAEIDTIAGRCREASTRLYRRIAAMPKRDKIAAGVQVYATDFLAPFARSAGLWDRMREEFDVHEWDPLTSELYYDLVRDGAAPVLGRLLLTGSFPPVRDPISAEEAWPALHVLAVRGQASALPADEGELESAGYVAATSGGWLLTDTGRAVHQRLITEERRTYEVERLTQAYERFIALNPQLKALVARWQTDEQARPALLAELADVISRARVALRRTNEQLQRFEGYLPRLRKALARAEAGEADYVAGVQVDSVHTVWLQLHEDYLLTQGLSREEEGSY